MGRRSREAGFGSVIASLTAFDMVSASVIAIDGDNPLISRAMAVKSAFA